MRDRSGLTFCVCIGGVIPDGLRARMSDDNDRDDAGNRGGGDREARGNGGDMLPTGAGAAPPATRQDREHEQRHEQNESEDPDVVAGRGVAAYQIGPLDPRIERLTTGYG